MFKASTPESNVQSPKFHVRRSRYWPWILSDAGRCTRMHDCRCVAGDRRQLRSWHAERHSHGPRFGADLESEPFHVDGYELSGSDAQGRLPGGDSGAVDLSVAPACRIGEIG